MKYLDEENDEKLYDLGQKILQARQLKSEITDFFVSKNDDGKQSEANYYCAQDLLDAINLFIKGESPDFIGEQVFQDASNKIIEIAEYRHRKNLNIKNNSKIKI